MRIVTLASVVVLMLSAAPTFAALTDDTSRHLTAVVSIKDQLMYLYEDDELVEEWKVSTARKGKVTPKGIFQPKWLSRNHRSSLYNNAPMPFAVFYSGHYAVHGTNEEGKLGRPASAGCVRLSNQNARKFFEQVRLRGMSNVTIEIVD